MTKSIIEPERECPRWEKCSVNQCPLDAMARERHPLDKEQKCPMEKQVRQRIGAKYPELLPMGGLNGREWHALKRFEALPLAVRLEMAEKGRERLKAYRRGKTGETDAHN
jgi:hypothetical protein